MNKGLGQLQPHLWKLLLVLMLIGLGAVLIRNNDAPSTATPLLADVVKIQEVTVQPSPPLIVEVTPTLTLKPTKIPTSEPLTPTPNFVPVFHIIQFGEMPLSIAAEYGITVEDLMDVNDITDPTILQIGQELFIPITATATPITPSPTPTPKVTPTPTPEPIYHTVEQGDILMVIASEYGSSTQAIMRANNITDPTSLQIGQQLLIPPDDGSEFLGNSPTTTHQVESGDTLLRIAFLYGSTVDDILEANPDLEPTALQIGQTVAVPVTAPPLNPVADRRLPRITSPDPLLPKLIALQQQMVEAINIQREAQGLSPYQPDEQLTTTALAHAQDMVTRGYFSHFSPEGLSVRERLQQQGIQVNWTGENIYISVQPADKAVEAAINWFMGDAPHRRNILHARYSRIGVGVAEGPPGFYFVQVFAGD